MKNEKRETKNLWMCSFLDRKNKRNIFFKSSYFQNFITNFNSPLLVKKFQLYHKE